MPNKKRISFEEFKRVKAGRIKTRDGLKHPEIELPHIPKFPKRLPDQPICDYVALVKATRSIGPESYEEYLAHIWCDRRARCRQHYWDRYSILEDPGRQAYWASRSGQPFQQRTRS
jgi:hypothetical protein